MYSMTGFGKFEILNDFSHIKAELKSLNSRYIDISFKLSRNFPLSSSLELKIRRLLREHLIRGAIDCSISIDFIGMDSNVKSYCIDEFRLVEYIKSLEDVKRRFNIEGDILLSDVMRLDNIFVEKINESNVDEFDDLIINCLEGAVKDLAKSREIEGLALFEDIVRNLDLFTDELLSIENNKKDLYPYWVNKFEKRLEALNQSDPEVKMRVAQEAAILAEKADINEEIVRLHAHIKQFKTLIKESVCGHNLNFLCQELIRELSTIGSKAHAFSLKKSVLNSRMYINKLKEQVQNVL